MTSPNIQAPDAGARPEPLSPPDCDLRGLAFMPLDIVRLFDSDFFALSSGDEFKAALSLWGKAFLQVPAGSLPADERILAHLSGSGASWPALREMALHGWVLCSDGRLYHPVVCEKAREAWKRRLAQRERIARRWDRRSPPAGGADAAPPSLSSDTTVSPGNNRGNTEAIQGTGTGTVQGIEKKDTSLRSVVRSPKVRKSPPDEPEGFADFYAAYPRREARRAASQAYSAALKRGASVGDLAAGLQRYQFQTDRNYQPLPATWLNQDRWRDEPAPQQASSSRAVTLPTGETVVPFKRQESEGEYFRRVLGLDEPPPEDQPPEFPMIPQEPNQ